VPTPLSQARMTLVETWEEASSFLSWLGERRPILAFDLETTGLSLAKDRVRLAQFGDADAGWALPWEDWRGVVRKVLGEYEGAIVGQNIKFDAGFVQRDGLPFPWQRAHDTKHMLFLDDSLGPQSLKPAAALHIDPAARAGEKELKALMRKHGWDYATFPINHPVYWGYGCGDTILTARLAEHLWPRVQYAREAYDLEMAVSRIVCDMEMRGVRLDVEYVDGASEVLAGEIAELEARLGDISPGSNDQVVAALQAEGVELTKRTEAGNFSVDEEALSAIDHPIAADVLAWRSKTKIRSAYFQNFLALEASGRLHPHINQLQARTGRMSVTNPALQTLPRDALVRDAIIPDDGCKLVLVDYDSEELRLMAHYSGDESMMRAFTEGVDMHMETARMAWGPDATKEDRNKAKGGVYGKAYGARAGTLSKTLGISIDEAQHLADTLSAAYPGMDRAMAKVSEAVRRRALEDNRASGYVVALDGRRIRVLAEKAYVGWNALIQGAGGVVLKQALVNLDAAGLGHTLWLPIHDEQMFNVPVDEVNDALPVIKQCMERDDLRVPLTVEATVVDRWGDKYRKAA
jgi:DNA polymerase-1